MFNSLKYAKILENAGVNREQAEAHVQIMTEFMESSFATKQDLKDQGTELRAEMKELGSELRAEMAKLQSEMKLLESRMVAKLGGIVVIGMGALLTLAKLLHI